MELDISENYNNATGGLFLTKVLIYAFGELRTCAPSKSVASLKSLGSSARGLSKIVASL